MKKIFIFLLCLTFTANAYSWNRLGHDTSAAIADKYLTKKARRNMSKYLDGHCMEWYASYMDLMGYVYKLGLSNQWFDHCVPVTKDFEYAGGDFGMSGNKQNGDAIMCITKAVEQMKDGGYKELPDSLVNLYLKWLIHFVPDSHCPSHIIYNFRPTNYHLDYGGEKLLFHGVWDGVPEKYGAHAWSPAEYRDHLTEGLTRKDIKEIEMGGDILAWVHQSAEDCIVAYDIVRPDNLTNVDRYNATVLADRQLLRGGIRLACLLNLIFG